METKRIGFGNWERVGAAMEADMLLPHQPMRPEFEYHITLFNSVEISVRNNTVADVF